MHGNPTTLDHPVFLDNLPHVRAIAFGVTDGYPRAHYEVVKEHTVKPDGEAAKSWQPLAHFVGASARPHAVFTHPRFASPPATETAAELFDRDAEHRAAALEALSPKVAAAFAELDAETAAAAGLCPSWFWETEKGPAVPMDQRLEALRLEDQRRRVADHEARQKAADAWERARTAAEEAWTRAHEAALLAQAKVELSFEPEARAYRAAVSAAAKAKTAADRQPGNADLAIVAEQAHEDVTAAGDALAAARQRPENLALAEEAQKAQAAAEEARGALQKASAPVPWTTPADLAPLTPEQVQKYHDGWDKIPAVVLRLGVRDQLRARAAAGSS